MKSKLINDGPQRSFVVVFDTGDEVTESLLAFAREQGLSAAEFTGLGAFSGVKRLQPCPRGELTGFVAGSRGEIALGERDIERFHTRAVVEPARTNRLANGLGHPPVECRKITGSIAVADRLFDHRLQPIDDLVDTATHHVGFCPWQILPRFSVAAAVGPECPAPPASAVGCEKRRNRIAAVRPVRTAARDG